MGNTQCLRSCGTITSPLEVVFTKELSCSTTQGKSSCSDVSSLFWSPPPANESPILRLATQDDREVVIDLFVSIFIEREPLCAAMNLDDIDLRPYATCIVDCSLRRSLLYLCEDHNGYLASFACVVDDTGHRDILDFAVTVTQSKEMFACKGIGPVVSIVRSLYSLLPQSFIEGRGTRVAYVHAVASVQMHMGYAKALLRFVHGDLLLQRFQDEEDSGFTHAVYACSRPEMVHLTMNEFGATRFGTLHPSRFQMPNPSVKQGLSRPFAYKLRGDVMLHVVDLCQFTDGDTVDLV